MILSFDPGVTTGVALLMDDGSVRYTTTISSVEELEAYCWAVKNDSQLKEDIVCVAEEGPKQSGNYRPYIQDIETVIKKHFPDVNWVPPGQWKGHPAASAPVVNATQHEKDAVGLGRWYRKTRMNASTNSS